MTAAQGDLIVWKMGVLVAAHQVSGYVGITRLVVDTAEGERERGEKERA